MQKLKDLFDQMTDAEKARTIDHLKEKEEEARKKGRYIKKGVIPWSY